MKDVVRYAEMLDLYGGILTEKQFEMLDSYYCRDLTLEEIAENNGISKQAVHFAIKNAQAKISKLEKQLGILARHDALEEMLSEAEEAIRNGEDDALVIRRLEDIAKKL